MEATVLCKKLHCGERRKTNKKTLPEAALRFPLLIAVNICIISVTVSPGHR